MPEYEVIISVGASATITVEAESEAEAIEAAYAEYDNSISDTTMFSDYLDVYDPDDVISVMEI
jgi:hypothetical protein